MWIYLILLNGNLNMVKIEIFMCFFTTHTKNPNLSFIRKVLNKFFSIFHSTHFSLITVKDSCPLVSTGDGFQDSRG